MNVHKLQMLLKNLYTHLRHYFLLNKQIFFVCKYMAIPLQHIHTSTLDFMFHKAKTLVRGRTQMGSGGLVARVTLPHYFNSCTLGNTRQRSFTGGL